jgi:hypothetical protein
LSSIYRALKGIRRSDGRRRAGGAAVERVAVGSVRQALWLLLRKEKDLAEEDVA